MAAKPRISSMSKLFYKGLHLIDVLPLAKIDVAAQLPVGGARDRTAPRISSSSIHFFLLPDAEALNPH
jgi:hypothetical protein